MLFKLSLPPLLPAPRPALERPMDGSSMDGRYAGNGAPQVSSCAAAVRFFIVSHKMPRIPEDCKYLEVFRSGKRFGALAGPGGTRQGLGKSSLARLLQWSPGFVEIDLYRSAHAQLKNIFVTSQEDPPDAVRPSANISILLACPCVICLSH